MNFKTYLKEENFDEGAPLWVEDYIQDLSEALEDYYIHIEEQAVDSEEFEVLGEAIGQIRQAFAKFQTKVTSADKIIQHIISNSEGLEEE